LPHHDHANHDLSSIDTYLPLTLRLHGAAVVDALHQWYRRSGRTFPWRRDVAHAERLVARGEPVNDPYLVLVSEVMLQQTQTARVAEMLPRFLERFPTVQALASASRGEVLRAWQGLGYNNRALRLHAAAQEIVAKHGGVFPRSLEALRALAGIGPYTAAAIACFAFGDDVPVVDVNIQRVLSRLFFKCHTVEVRQSDDVIMRVDAALIPERGGYWWHQALMDHGATICTARRPACERCPLVEQCLSAFPRPLALFGSEARDEPSIAGVPRRVWRGRIVEYLRRTHDAVDVRSVIDELHGAIGASEVERSAIRAVVATLLAEGLLVAESPTVREGGELADETRVRLLH
jgi:A/G-specific adenine glycosylase